MLEIGAAARDFQLKQIDGKSCAVGAENGDGPVLLAFFSVDCPTCQLTMPYIDRLADAVASSGGRVIAVSQDPPDATRTFLDQTGCRLPVRSAPGGRIESPDPSTTR